MNVVGSEHSVLLAQQPSILVSFEMGVENWNQCQN